MEKKKKDSINMLNYFKCAQVEIILMCIMMIVSCIIGILNPIFTANLLTSITNFDVNKVILFATLVTLITLFSNLENQLTNLIYLKGIKRKIFTNIRKDMLDNIFRLKMSTHDKHSSGEFSERLRHDPESVSSILTVVQYSFFSIVKDFLILGYVFYVNFFIGIIYLICVLLIYFYQKYAYQKTEIIEKECRNINDKTSTLLNETIRGIRDIKVLNMFKPVNKLLVEQLLISSDKNSERDLANQKIYNVTQSLQTIGMFFVILVGVLMTINNKLSITNLLIIYMYRIDIFDIVLCYSSIKQYLVQYKVASSRIFELLDDEKFPKETFGNTKLKDIEGKIVCNNLSFAYDKKEILHNVNFTIKPKETIAFVGGSGSGKTTLLNLLNKSYNVDDGCIFIDNIDINDLTMNSIRNNVSVISQNPYIFNLTIKENFELVRSDITMKQIIEVCKIAQIHDFIMSLPNQYNTLIGEGGTNLSGGQKQRLAIARALIKKSKIILFDEATSALANVTQMEVQKALNNISDDYTMIIVAHRLSTIKSCDKIFVMKNGKILDSGTHSYLLENCREYQKLYQNDEIKV